MSYLSIVKLNIKILTVIAPQLPRAFDAEKGHKYYVIIEQMLLRQLEELKINVEKKWKNDN